jgi:hypothetical protein
MRMTGAAVLTAMLTLVAAPAFASSGPESTRTAKAFTSKAIAKAVANTTPSVSATPTPAPKAPQGSNPSFFRSRTGMLVLGVFAVGAGYAVYSAREDRVRGSGR